MNLANGRHSRNDVIDAALSILDQFGLPDLTMRRLASSLDVQASALYWHFPNKQTLLASVSDRIVSRAVVTPADSGGWRETTYAQASAFRDALLAYRDGAEVVSSSLALGLGGADAFESMRSAIALGDFDDDTCDAAAAALLHFVLGHVFHEQQRMQADGLGVLGENHAATVGRVESAGMHAGGFATGIRLFLDGLGVQLRARGDSLSAADTARG